MLSTPSSAIKKIAEMVQMKNMLIFAYKIESRNTIPKCMGCPGFCFWQSPTFMSNFVEQGNEGGVVHFYPRFNDTRSGVNFGPKGRFWVKNNTSRVERKAVGCNGWICIQRRLHWVWERLPLPPCIEAAISWNVFEWIRASCKPLCFLMNMKNIIQFKA